LFGGAGGIWTPIFAPLHPAKPRFIGIAVPHGAQCTALISILLDSFSTLFSCAIITPPRRPVLLPDSFIEGRMRLAENYKRSGFFWLPGKEERKIPGELLVFDGGKAQLEIVGLFDDSIAGRNKGEDISRIIGEIEKDGLVTLDNCFYLQRSLSFGGISRSKLRVNRVFCGVGYERDEKVTLNSVVFSVEGLQEWVAISGINVSYGDQFDTATISYTRQNDITYSLSDGFKLHILFSYMLPGMPHLAEAKISQKIYLKLTSDEDRDFEDFIKIVHHITYFLCFAIDATVTISDVVATSSEVVQEFAGGVKQPAKIRLFYSSLPFSIEPPKIEADRILFRLIDIAANAERILNNWINAFLVIRPAIGLYFSAVSGTHQYLDGRFLALAQGLETYHRRTSSETLMDTLEFRSLVAKLLWGCDKGKRKWLRSRLMHGNEISLSQRIKRIIEPYKEHLGNTRQRNKIIRGLVNTRNYLTHYDEKTEEQSSKGLGLWLLCQKMEAIFQLHLLQQLGFTKPEIENILENNYKLSQKLGK